MPLDVRSANEEAIRAWDTILYERFKRDRHISSVRSRDRSRWATLRP